MVPSSMPRPCRHTGRRARSEHLPEDTNGEEEGEPTFLLTTVDDLEIFGDGGAGVFLHVSVGEAERPVVTNLSVPREDALNCAGA